MGGLLSYATNISPPPRHGHAVDPLRTDRDQVRFTFLTFFSLRTWRHALHTATPLAPHTTRARADQAVVPWRASLLRPVPLQAPRTWRVAYLRHACFPTCPRLSHCRALPIAPLHSAHAYLPACLPNTTMPLYPEKVSCPGWAGGPFSSFCHSCHLSHPAVRISLTKRCWRSVSPTSECLLNTATRLWLYGRLVASVLERRPVLRRAYGTLPKPRNTFPISCYTRACDKPYRTRGWFRGAFYTLGPQHCLQPSLRVTAGYRGFFYSRAGRRISPGGMAHGRDD